MRGVLWQYRGRKGQELKTPIPLGLVNLTTDSDRHVVATFETGAKLVLDMYLFLGYDNGKIYIEDNYIRVVAWEYHVAKNKKHLNWHTRQEWRLVTQ